MKRYEGGFVDTLEWLIAYVVQIRYGNCSKTRFVRELKKKVTLQIYEDGMTKTAWVLDCGEKVIGVKRVVELEPEPLIAMRVSVVVVHP